MNKKTVCVDLDGVLAHYDGWKGDLHIGEPRPGAVEFTRWLSGGACVVVFTTRCKADLPDRKGARAEELAGIVRAWLDEHGFRYDEVYIGQGKPIAVAYLDDRNVAIRTNPGELEFLGARAELSRLLNFKDPPSCQDASKDYAHPTK